MRRIILALLLIAPTSTAVLAQGVELRPGQSAAAQANAQLQRDQARDRVADAARDIATDGRQGTPALVDDMDRYRGAIAPERREVTGTTQTDAVQGSIPSLGGNIQR
ncbi:hypothetical protein [Muricoccus radiodurans]|uniref:hypothetical protein n=1 Tax=Muricoccus radiodurans TaxID=2231721 RepID=UPI003CF5683B